MVAPHPEDEPPRPAPVPVARRHAADEDGLRPVRGLLVGLLLAAAVWALAALVWAALAG